MKKKTLVLMMIVSIIAVSLTFADSLYISTNQRILLIHDDGTWENYTQIEEDGTSREVWNNVRFENRKWDSTEVVKVGKWIEDGLFIKMAEGCFYRLEMSTTQEVKKSALSWSDPIMMLSDGSFIEGTMENLTDTSYSMVFDVPNGLEPCNIGFKTSNDDDYGFCYIAY